MGLLFMIGVFLIAIILTLISLLIIKLRHLKLAAAFNGPPALPLLGNALEFAGIDHNEMIQRINALQTKFGSPARIWFGPHLVISIADHKNMEIVMKSSENLNKSIHHKYFDFMNGVFLAEDDRWKRLRKMVNSMFHASSMEGHIQIFNKQSKVMCEVLKTKIGKGVFDVKTVVNDCILDIICQTAMRTPMNIQQNQNFQATFSDDVSHIAEITMQRVSKIWLYPNIIFNNTNLGKERDVLKKKILEFVKSVIKRRKQLTMEESKNSVISYGKYAKSYLDMMLEYGVQENMNEDRLAMEINDLLVAGSDTSAVAVSYALVMLGIDQNLQYKVFTELFEIFGDSDRDATMDDLTLMTQLEMVAKETVRITCPPHMARTVDKDIKLDDENLIIPAGSTLYMLLYRLHRNPDYWSHPNEFYPDHFLPENEATRPKFSFLPFSYGLRICPGHKYGIYSLKVVLSTILRRYKVITELKPNELKYRVAIMLELANGYPVRFELRNAINKL